MSGDKISNSGRSLVLRECCPAPARPAMPARVSRLFKPLKKLNVPTHLTKFINNMSKVCWLLALVIATVLFLIAFRRVNRLHTDGQLLKNKPKLPLA